MSMNSFLTLQKRFEKNATFFDYVTIIYLIVTPYLLLKTDIFIIYLNTSIIITILLFRRITEGKNKFFIEYKEIKNNKKRNTRMIDD